MRTERKNKCATELGVKMINKVLKILYSHRFPLAVEKETQAAIEQRFVENGIEYNREYKLDEQNIPDFFIDGIAVEVKIKGNAKQIYRQCERYCNFDEVRRLVLVTNRSMGFPEKINGKDCYMVNLGKAWL